MTFPCTSCGACCRRIGQSQGHGLPVNPDGSCGHLKNNLCEIYDTRPDFCRIDHMIGDKPQLLELTARLCNQFQVEDGMGEEFRLKVNA
jgi:Fe-S-cluster containining protein